MFEALTPFGIKWGTFVCYSLKETATRQKQAGSSPAFNYNSKLYVLKSIQSLAKAINPLMVFHILPRLQTCMNITGILIGVESNTVVRLRFHTMWSLSCFTDYQIQISNHVSFFPYWFIKGRQENARLVLPEYFCIATLSGKSLNVKFHFLLLNRSIFCLITSQSWRLCRQISSWIILWYS